MKDAQHKKSIDLLDSFFNTHTEEEIKKILGSSDRDEVKTLGERIGYGNMMHLASELWKQDMIEHNYPTSGVFIPVVECDIKKSAIHYYIKKK